MMPPSGLRQMGLTTLFLLKNRITTYWGDFSYVEAEIETMRVALSSNATCDRFVVIQGSDYPIVSHSMILDYFKKNTQLNYINAFDVLKRGDGEITKYIFKWNLKSKSRLANHLRKFKVAIGRKCPSIFKRKTPYIRISTGDELRIYGGWAHFSVVRSVAEYFVSFHDSHPEYNAYFRSVYAADESYFHTIFWNSPYASTNVVPYAFDHWEEKLLLNNTYMEYPSLVREWHDALEYSELCSTGKLFFRKVDSSRGCALLDEIDRMAGIDFSE